MSSVVNALENAGYRVAAWPVRVMAARWLRGRPTPADAFDTPATPATTTLWLRPGTLRLAAPSNGGVSSDLSLIPPFCQRVSDVRDDLGGEQGWGSAYNGGADIVTFLSSDLRARPAWWPWRGGVAVGPGAPIQRFTSADGSVQYAREP